MSVNHPQLMRYYDGELSDEEAAEVEAALENDPDAQRVFEGLEQLSAFVRKHGDEQVLPDLTDAIMGRIAREERKESARPAEVVRGPWSTILPAAAAVLALAAGVALVNELSNKPGTTTPVVQQPSSTSEEPVAPVSSEEPAEEQVLAADTHAVAIETVDFGAREGTIFVMQEGEGSTPVVWLMDEPAPAGGRMEPL
jgi:anti-sigma factor RsiW